MESERHVHQMTLLIQSLKDFWQDRDDFFVGGNMFIYYSELQAKKNDFRGPDVFVVLGTQKRERKSWVVWEEDGRTPDVVIELLSGSTEATDRGKKMDIYARSLRVAEYFLFDPFTARLEGYRLDPEAATYRPMQTEEHGWLPAARLGLSLGVFRGTYCDVETEWLRWVDEHGRVVMHPSERADAEAQRAESEAQRAETEARRASELAVKLAAYEARFGKL